ncbi:alpha-1B adrenergic receptor [Elysia marginata]|uniref:Alpha-1B adrenergic receptor n=1 Tax=Elysia marginata TaxID=1093978 RepID=A0AAV4HTP4_9GAST|nr:alpha-1B adrenergic receptor [Elysia marginata]
MDITYINATSFYDNITNNNTSVFDDVNNSSISLLDNTTDTGLDLQQVVIIPMTPGQKAFVASVNAIIAIITTVVNVPVLVIWLAGSRREHTPSSAVVLNLFIFDLSVAGALYLRVGVVLLMSFSFSLSLPGALYLRVGVVLSSHMASNQFACLAHFSFLIYGGLGMQVALTMAILDRYIAIAHPFRYLEIVNYKVVLGAMLCTHLYVGCLSFVALIPSANNWGGPGTNCTFNLVLTQAHIYTIMCNLLAFMAISLSMYARVLIIAKRHRKRIAAGPGVLTCADLSQYSGGQHNTAFAWTTTTAPFPGMSNPKQNILSSYGEPSGPSSGDLLQTGKENKGQIEQLAEATQRSPQSNVESRLDGAFLAKGNSEMLQDKQKEGKDRLCWTRFNDERERNIHAAEGSYPGAAPIIDNDTASCNSLLYLNNIHPPSNCSSLNQVDGVVKKTSCQSNGIRTGDHETPCGAVSALNYFQPTSPFRSTTSPIYGNLQRLSNIAHLNKDRSHSTADSDGTEGGHSSRASDYERIPKSERRFAVSSPCGAEFFEWQSTKKAQHGVPPSSDSFNKVADHSEKTPDQVIANIDSQTCQLPLSPLTVTAVPTAKETQCVFSRDTWELQTERNCARSVNQSTSGIWFGKYSGKGDKSQTLGGASVVLSTHADSIEVVVAEAVEIVVVAVVAVIVLVKIFKQVIIYRLNRCRR